MRGIMSLYNRFVAAASSRTAEAIALLFARIGLALIFWRAARTKIEDGTLLTMSDTTVLLFREEYGMPLPHVTGLIATYAEHFLPILLILGLFTRIGALGLLIMTAVIQFWVYPEFLIGLTDINSKFLGTHIVWAALAGIILVRGPGPISADQLLARSRVP